MSTEEQSHLQRLARELGMEDPAGLLSEKLSGSDLSTLLLEVFRRRTRSSNAGDLLRRYGTNRFVKPSAVNAIDLRQLELDTLKIARNHSFSPVQLSPVAPLGSCSIVAAADQNKIISSLRGTEVVADATNLLALHISELLKTRKISHRDDFVRQCTTHRHVRAQYFGNAPGMFPHFHLFCMVTAGRDQGSYHFEALSFWEHIRVYQDIFQSLFQSDIELVLSVRKGETDPDGLVQRILDHGESIAPGVAASVNRERNPNPYYKGLQFTMVANVNGRVHSIGDGGFVDWSAQLLGNKKERMLISAIGLDRLLLTEGSS